MEKNQKKSMGSFANAIGVARNLKKREGSRDPWEKYKASKRKPRKSAWAPQLTMSDKQSEGAGKVSGRRTLGSNKVSRFFKGASLALAKGSVNEHDKVMGRMKESPERKIKEPSERRKSFIAHERRAYAKGTSKYENEKRRTTTSLKRARKLYNDAKQKKQ